MGAQLSTDRLRLKVATPQDAPVYAAYHKNNRAHLEPWQPDWPLEITTVAYWERRLECANTHEQIRLLWFIPGQSTCIGLCNFHIIARGAFWACNLGFSVDADKQGKGYAYEALSCALDYAFRDLALHRVQANHLPENLRSARLLRRLGFVPEGYARDYLYIRGAWRDHVLTAKTNPDPMPPGHAVPPSKP